MLCLNCHQWSFWLRLPLVETSEVGHDEGSAQVLLRKLDALEKDTNLYKDEIERLAAVINAMTRRNHFDSTHLQANQDRLTQEFNTLQQLCHKRRSQLGDAIKFVPSHHIHHPFVIAFPALADRHFFYLQILRLSSSGRRFDVMVEGEGTVNHCGRLWKGFGRLSTINREF